MTFKKSYYFSHDYHARHDPKLERLRMELGPVSDGIFWDLVEMLYEENGYLSIQDIPLYSKMLNTNEQVLNKVVTNLFVVDGDRFYNQSLLDRLEHINNICGKRSFAGKASGKARQKNICSTSVEHMSNIRERGERGDKEKKINNKELFGEFVYLTTNEYTQLVAWYGEQGAKKRIENLNTYIGAKGKKYKSHYHTILMWENKNAGSTGTGFKKP